MADIHIDDFCRDTALTLVTLYNAFPRRHTIYVEDISGPDEVDEVGLHSVRFQACLGAMLWLAEEGYIRYESLVYREGIDQAVLTNKTFVILSAASDVRFDDPIDPTLPESVTSAKLSLVNQIRQALRSGSSNNITKIMRYFMSQQPMRLQSPDTGAFRPDNNLIGTCEPDL